MPMTPNCRCYEAFIEEDDGHNDRHSARLDRIAGAEGHDCDYIRQRNKLIPLAEKAANEEIPSEERVRGNHTEPWVRAFLGHMDRLVFQARKAGIRI